MKSADLEVLRAMRTRWHTPAAEEAMRLLGKAGNNAAIWVGLNVALSIVDSAHGEAWLICAVLGPIAIGLNYVVKLVVEEAAPGARRACRRSAAPPARSASPPPTRPRRSPWRRR